MYDQLAITQSTIIQFIRLVRELFYRWYSKDRIRQSPTRGSLVRLQVADRVLIRDMLFVVVDKDTMFHEHVSRIVYSLREPESPTLDEGKIFLELRGLDLQFISAKLEFRGKMIELFEDDPIVL